MSVLELYIPFCAEASDDFARDVYIAEARRALDEAGAEMRQCILIQRPDLAGMPCWFYASDTVWPTQPLWPHVVLQ